VFISHNLSLELMGYLIPVTPQAFVNIISWCEKDYLCVNFIPIIYRFHYCNEHFYTITNLEYELHNYLKIEKINVTALELTIGTKCLSNIFIWLDARTELTIGLLLGCIKLVLLKLP